MAANGRTHSVSPSPSPPPPTGNSISIEAENRQDGAGPWETRRIQNMVSQRNFRERFREHKDAETRLQSAQMHNGPSSQQSIDTRSRSISPPPGNKTTLKVEDGWLNFSSNEAAQKRKIQNRNAQRKFRERARQLAAKNEQEKRQHGNDASGSQPPGSLPDISVHSGARAKGNLPPEKNIGQHHAHLQEPSTGSFVRPPLDYPGAQIRLLSFKPGILGHPDDPLSLNVTSWDLGQAPPFRAISYTWGSAKDLKTLFIGGQSFVVRQHCHYALSQARLLYPDTYIWVDSICIDQENTNEKSQQVSLMADIYAKASAVLACIGPHDEHSRFVQAALPDVEPGRDIPVTREPWTQIDRSRWQSWTGVRSFTYITELCRSYERLMHRGYWSRLWVVQELVGGSNHIQVLCGESILDWWRLRELGAMLQYHRDLCQMPYTDYDLEPLPCMELWEFAMAYERASLELVLYRTKTLQCANILDRVYGVLRLVEWPENTPALIPDYSKTAAELATDVIELVAPTNPYLTILDDLLRTLGLDNEIFLSSIPTTPFWQSAQPWQMNILCAYRIVSVRDHLVIFDQASHRSATDSRQSPTPYAVTSPSPDKELGGLAARTAVERAYPVIIYNGDLSEPWSFSCNDTQPGDILISNARQDLILREGTDGELMVVGAAVAPYMREYPTVFCECTPGSPIELWGDVHLQGYLNIKDAIALATRVVQQPEAGVARLEGFQVGARVKTVTKDRSRTVSLSHLLEQHWI